MTAVQARAQCPGQGTATLDVLGLPRIGTTVTLYVTGPPSAPFFLAGDTSPGPVSVPGVGTICLGLTSNLFILAQGNLDEGGAFRMRITVPEEPPLRGMTVHLQALVQTAGGIALSPGVRFRVVGGPAVYVPQSDNRVGEIDAETGESNAVPGVWTAEHHGLALDEAGGHLYAVDGGYGTAHLLQIDLRENTVVRGFATGVVSGSCAVAGNPPQVYVFGNLIDPAWPAAGGIVRIDPRTGTRELLAVVDPCLGNYIWSTRACARGTWLAVSWMCGGNPGRPLAALNCATGALTRLNTGWSARDLTFGPLGARLYAGSPDSCMHCVPPYVPGVHALDMTTLREAGSVPAGTGDVVIAISPDGRRGIAAWTGAARLFDAVQLTAIQDLSLAGGDPMGAAVSPGGPHAFVATWVGREGRLIKIDMQTGQIVQTLQLSGGPTGRIWIW